MKKSVSLEDHNSFLEHNEISSDAKSHFQGMSLVLRKIYVSQMFDKIDWNSNESFNSKLKYFYSLDKLDIFTKQQMRTAFRKQFNKNTKARKS